MESIIKPLRALHWHDAETVEPATTKACQQILASPDDLWQTLRTLSERPGLLALCEHYDILDKIVLWDDPSGIRVRLHVFLPGHFDRPHNHRWSYTSTILRGQYYHYLFGDAELDNDDPGSLTALMVRTEQAGTTYTLHHTMVHAVVAEPYTVSLVIRGPAVKDRFLVMDRTTGESWWQYGSGQESASDTAAKQMRPERLAELTDSLSSWNVF